MPDWSHYGTTLYYTTIHIKEELNNFKKPNKNIFMNRFIDSCSNTKT